MTEQLVDVRKCVDNLDEIDEDLKICVAGLQSGELELKVASERINANGKRLKVSQIQQKWADMAGQKMHD